MINEVMFTFYTELNFDMLWCKHIFYYHSIKTEEITKERFNQQITSFLRLITSL